MPFGNTRGLSFTIVVCLLSALCLNAFGQEPEERFLYVVDSIPILEDPEEGEGTLSENEIETITVVTNPGEIAKLGYKDLDKLIFIITKEYAKRPQDVRSIPTTKEMERRDGKWYLRNSASPYNGRFIDYYYNGRIQGEGVLKEGVLHGIRTVYHQNGNRKYFRTYVNGVLEGDTEDYFSNGQIHQKGYFKNGKNEGLWQDCTRTES
jgi:hypothetical protein